LPPGRRDRVEAAILSLSIAVHLLALNRLLDPEAPNDLSRHF
jgi:hypothetical protein